MTANKTDAQLGVEFEQVEYEQFISGLKQLVKLMREYLTKSEGEKENG